MSFAYLGRFCIRIACALDIWLFSGTLDAFGVQTEEKQKRKSECPMTPSAKVLYRSLGAMPGQITRRPICSFCTQPDKLRTKKRREAKATTRSPLDRTRSQGRWTIQSRLHCISLDRKGHDVKIRYLSSILICFIFAYISSLLGFSLGQPLFIQLLSFATFIAAMFLLPLCIHFQVFDIQFSFKSFIISVIMFSIVALLLSLIMSE